MNYQGQELFTPPIHEYDTRMFLLDHKGDPYIPLHIGETFRLRDLVRKDRPAFSFGTHLVLVREDSETRVTSIEREGLLSPARWGVLSTDPIAYYRRNFPMIVCSSLLTWTNEFLQSESEENRFLHINEPLIGIADQDARRLVPIGYAIQSKTHREKITSNNYIWRYIPPSHIVAIIRSDEGTHKKVKVALDDAMDQFKNGVLAEKDLATVFQKYIPKLSVDLKDQSTNINEVALHLAAVATETEIFIAMQSALYYKFPDKYLNELRVIKPSYSFTESLLHKVREIIH